MSSPAASNIDSVLKETRQFPPPAEFAAQAHVKSLAEYERLWQEAQRRPAKASGASRPSRCTGSAAGTRCWSGTSRTPSGSSAASSTPATTASTATWPARARTRPPSSGKASRATAACSRYQDLHREVCKFANVLKGLGIQAGDRVTIYMPMVPELAIAMLACARIGATHSVIFGGFSAEAVADRNNDAKARLLITADGGWRRGKVVPLKQNVDAALDKSPTVEKCIVFNRCNQPVDDEARPRPVVARADGRRLRRLPRRAARQRAPALHPLHQRLDRQTQGRAAHHGRLPARRRADAPLGLRPPRGRHLLVYRRHRLGDRTQLHRLRPAGQRRHHA